ncbi:hypothetical protein GALMADRAFT_266511 [Galerina marginata CBS 339.88]|uniref:Glycoside hydrolase family 12 protein n=1 Tax=Galerina marginata (strain CBS 339.88) TaxID=685588 RepID=A0A067T472_GALM3|nr:hypothetical protein GALMADRAFT_266511 [Galerina marginata CBS 339.88]
MVFSKSLFALALLASTTFGVLASPTPAEETQELSKRGAVLSGQWASETEPGGRFTLSNNLWGQASASSGSQTSQALSVSGNTVSWRTTYNWAGGPYSVKSYSNLNLLVGLSKSLSSIKSIPTTWNWKYTSASSNLVADVSYDLWLSNSKGTSGASSQSTFEIMIWLSSRGGAGPVGPQIGTASVNGVTWKLHKGQVQNWTCISFVAPSEITNFNNDLKPFFNYLISNQGVPSSAYLVQAQSGTEPFTGSATLTTNSYTLAVN